MQSSHGMAQSQSPLVPDYLGNLTLLGRGSTGLVFKIDDCIAIKIANRVAHGGDNKDHAEKALAHENRIYDIFESQEPCPYILQSFLRSPRVNFLAFMSGGTLDELIEGYQLRTPNGRLVSITQTVPMVQAEQWAMELATAIAWLEKIGLAHCDLRPVNLMLDREGHLKLIDFEEVHPIGSISHGQRAPWARLQGREAGSQRGTWGFNGARTVQFSFASVMYTIVYGMEPYEDQFQTEVPDWLQRMKFPRLGSSALDDIIGRCWRGHYVSLKDLAEETTNLAGAALASIPSVMGSEETLALKTRCLDLLSGDLAELLDI
ncbi:hypothetical protein NQ176_g5229 [Zarea fungicola]|uniref:Uncharacterized protein n=1 Tax=Zarea fungicola TaxID=93591 RepID=A0ACC1NAK6_9HYPO|nr:hypothetical protein NQ176_g5229 [Lecanicillium fungicola]